MENRPNGAGRASGNTVPLSGIGMGSGAGDGVMAGHGDGWGAGRGDPYFLGRAGYGYGAGAGYSNSEFGDGRSDERGNAA